MAAARLYMTRRKRGGNFVKLWGRWEGRGTWCVPLDAKAHQGLQNVEAGSGEKLAAVNPEVAWCAVL